MLYSDPSGHNPLVIAALAFFVAAHLTDDRALQQFSAVVLAISLGGIDGAPFHTAAGAKWTVAASSAFALTTTVAYLQTGDIKASVRAGAWSALSAGVANGLGTSFENGVLQSAELVERAALHGLTQGVISQLRGDDFAAGFVSGLAGEVSGHYTKEASLEIGTAIVMVSGYITAEAVGGDGMQGAINAAIVFLYNKRAHVKREGRKLVYPTSYKGQKTTWNWEENDYYSLAHDVVDDWDDVPFLEYKTGKNFKIGDHKVNLSVEYKIVRRKLVQVRVYRSAIVERYKYSLQKTGRTLRSHRVRLFKLKNTHTYEYGLQSQLPGLPPSKPVSLSGGRKLVKD